MNCPLSLTCQENSTKAPKADTGPKERWQHASRVLLATGRTNALVARVKEAHILDALLTRGFITSRQLEAAMRLKRDFYYAGLEQRITGAYNPTTGERCTYDLCYTEDRTPLQEIAYRRWRRAIAALDPKSKGVVVAVACFDEASEARHIDDLRTGLGSLAAWYHRKSDLSEDVNETAAWQVGAGSRADAGSRGQGGCLPLAG